jgi:hypothetical protein
MGEVLEVSWAASPVPSPCATLTFFLVNAVLNAGVSGKAPQMAGAAIGLTLYRGVLEER